MMESVSLYRNSDFPYTKLSREGVPYKLSLLLLLVRQNIEYIPGKVGRPWSPLGEACGEPPMGRGTFAIIPNKYVRKTDRGVSSAEIYELAFEEVTFRVQSLRSAASAYNINYMSLQRYIKKKKAYQANLTDKPPSVGYVSQTVFLKDEENVLCEYLLTCAASNYGLTTKETRRLAYMLAKKHDKKFPTSWEENKMADVDFLPSQVTDRIPTSPEPNQRFSMTKESENQEIPAAPDTSENIGERGGEYSKAPSNKILPDNEDAVINSTKTPAGSSFICSKNVNEPAKTEHIASTSTARSPLVTISNEFSPEALRPLPKAPPRKGHQRNRRKIRSAVLTDTPIKDEIAAIEASRKNVKRRIFNKDNSKKAKKMNSRKNQTDDEEEEEENDCFCLCCLEPFANSKSREKWVQCIDCKGWSHEACTGGELLYVCHNCLSD
ncbi:unnamed protein product [Acanthoscelides obtectus]|uniref:HTH psq-type domain-containing protein n=1 Tax=Acanthoscelides obtectus TaxID=200917 RepID=A0A9P0P1M3_ACAOB|nr:unnamed protein product [Acanthoscelides obtectus]CAK1648977.1 hypothetical protein AOBTE_LOCUS15979 [Acanthoscelides obtectus]